MRITVSELRQMIQDVLRESEHVQMGDDMNRVTSYGHELGDDDGTGESGENADINEDALDASCNDLDEALGANLDDYIPQFYSGSGQQTRGKPKLGLDVPVPDDYDDKADDTQEEWPDR
jgi:hypothetical protein